MTDSTGRPTTPEDPAFERLRDAERRRQNRWFIWTGVVILIVFLAFVDRKLPTLTTPSGRTFSLLGVGHQTDAHGRSFVLQYRSLARDARQSAAELAEVAPLAFGLAEQDRDSLLLIRASRQLAHYSVFWSLSRTQDTRYARREGRWMSVPH